MSKFRKEKNNKEKLNNDSIGGIPFFATLLSLLILSIFNLRYLPQLWDDQTAHNSKFLIVGFSLGAWVSFIFFRNSISVLIHETKHSIVSNLVGNRSKGMKVKSESGEFVYEYTRSTAKFNALIALAPYFLPCFAFLAILVAVMFFKEQHQIMVAIISAGFGADLVLNFRDVSPIQTDLTRITGGYRVGVTFVYAINFVILSFFVAWCWHSWDGILMLIMNLWDTMTRIVIYLQTNVQPQLGKK